MCKRCNKLCCHYLSIYRVAWGCERRGKESLKHDISNCTCTHASLKFPKKRFSFLFWKNVSLWKLREEKIYLTRKKWIKNNFNNTEISLNINTDVRCWEGKNPFHVDCRVTEMELNHVIILPKDTCINKHVKWIFLCGTINFVGLLISVHFSLFALFG